MHPVPPIHHTIDNGGSHDRTQDPENQKKRPNIPQYPHPRPARGLPKTLRHHVHHHQTPRRHVGKRYRRLRLIPLYIRLRHRRRLVPRRLFLKKTSHLPLHDGRIRRTRRTPLQTRQTQNRQILPLHKIPRRHPHPNTQKTYKRIRQSHQSPTRLMSYQTILHPSMTISFGVISLFAYPVSVGELIALCRRGTFLGLLNDLECTNI